MATCPFTGAAASTVPAAHPALNGAQGVCPFSGKSQADEQKMKPWEYNKMRRGKKAVASGGCPVMNTTSGDPDMMDLFDPGFPRSSKAYRSDLLEPNLFTKKKTLCTRKFDAFPEFLRHTILHGADIKKSRKREFLEKMYLFEVIKSKGNDALLAGSSRVACQLFEKAMSLFWWIEVTNPEWMLQGLDDGDIEERVDEGEDEKDKKYCVGFRVTAMNCVAAAFLQMHQFDLALKACDEGLKLNPDSALLLLRRAQARALNLASSSCALEEAVQDVDAALARQPSPVLEAHKKKFVEDLHARRAAETKFITELLQSLSQNNARLRHSMHELCITPSLHQDPQEIKDLRRMVRHYEKFIKFTEDTAEKAENVEEKLAQPLKDFTAIATVLRDCVFVHSVDFRTPNELVLNLAGKYNLDLNDGMVRAELQHSQRELVGRLYMDASSQGTFNTPLLQLMATQDIMTETSTEVARKRVEEQLQASNTKYQLIAFIMLVLVATGLSYWFREVVPDPGTIPQL